MVLPVSDFLAITFIFACPVFNSTHAKESQTYPVERVNHGIVADSGRTSPNSVCASVLLRPRLGVRPEAFIIYA